MAALAGRGRRRHADDDRREIRPGVFQSRSSIGMAPEGGTSVDKRRGRFYTNSSSKVFTAGTRRNALAISRKRDDRHGIPGPSTGPGEGDLVSVDSVASRSTGHHRRQCYTFWAFGGESRTTRSDCWTSVRRRSTGRDRAGEGRAGHARTPNTSAHSTRSRNPPPWGSKEAGIRRPERPSAGVVGTRLPREDYAKIPKHSGSSGSRPQSSLRGDPWRFRKQDDDNDGARKEKS